MSLVNGHYACKHYVCQIPEEGKVNTNEVALMLGLIESTKILKSLYGYQIFFALLLAQSSITCTLTTPYFQMTPQMYKIFQKDFMAILGIVFQKIFYT